MQNLFTTYQKLDVCHSLSSDMHRRGDGGAVNAHSYATVFQHTACEGVQQNKTCERSKSVGGPLDCGICASLAATLLRLLAIQGQ